MKKILVSVLIAFGFILFGCIEYPIQVSESITTYEFFPDGSMKTTNLLKGPLTNASSKWSEDCTEQYFKPIDLMIYFFETASKMNESAQGTKSIELFKEVIQFLKERQDCRFEKSGSQGSLYLTSYYTEDDFSTLQELLESLSELNASQQAPVNLSEYYFVKREGSTLVTEFNASKSLTISLASDSTKPVKQEVRIKVHGSIISVSPNGYEKQGEEIVYKDLSLLERNKVKIVFSDEEPVSSPIELTASPSPKFIPASKKEVVQEKKEEGLNIYLLIALVAVIVLVALLLLRIFRKGHVEGAAIIPPKNPVNPPTPPQPPSQPQQPIEQESTFANLEKELASINQEKEQTPPNQKSPDNEFL